jgi:hypothetical protein
MLHSSPIASNATPAKLPMSRANSVSDAEARGTSAAVTAAANAATTSGIDAAAASHPPLAPQPPGELLKLLREAAGQLAELGELLAAPASAPALTSAGPSPAADDPSMPASSFGAINGDLNFNCIRVSL